MQQQKILHLCKDSLFNEVIVSLFEGANPGQNDYIIISDTEVLKFLKHDAVKIVSKAAFKTLYPQYKSVVIHSLFGENLWACSLLKEQKVMWSSWGGDLLGEHPYFSEEYLLDEQSRKALHEHEHQRRSGTPKTKQMLYDWFEKTGPLHKWYYRFRTGEHHPKYLLKMAYRQVDYVSTVLLSEKKILPALPGLKAEFHWINYGYLEIFVKGFYGKDFNLGKGIMIGHSAFFSSRQLEAFQRLAQVKTDIPVFVPIAYGYEDYKQLLKEKGGELFGERIRFQEKVLTQEEYVKGLTDCHVMILNTRKQEAVGNLLIGLYLGMRVFLNPDGFLYDFCKEMGCKVFSILEMTEENVSTYLPADAVAHNRERLEAVYGKEVVLERIRALVGKLMSS